jgi:serine/threonine protein phosphatase PrpC
METSIFDVGVRSQAYPGEVVAGDVTAIVENRHRLLTALADGLGHGRDARRSAERAIDAVCGLAFESLDGALHAAHDALIGRKMRGAVIGLALFDADAQTVTFAGVGNIDLIVVDGVVSRLAAQHGILGAAFPHVRTSTLTFSPKMLALLCSDGISAKLDARRYHNLGTLSAQILADAIVRDGRMNDDATAIVVKHSP